MLAILKAGAAYVPVDPHAPPVRASFVLADCDVKGIISTTVHLQRLREHAKQLDHVETIILFDEEGGADLTAPLKGRIYGWANAQDEGGAPFVAPERSRNRSSICLVYIRVDRLSKGRGH